MIVMTVLLLLLGGFLWWSRKSIKTTRYFYWNKALPSALDGLRIVHLSDLQSEYFGKAQRRILEKTRAASPDLIVFTGDLTDRNHTDYQAGITLMEGLVKIAPVYYVDGNHELALPVEEISQMYDVLEGMGVVLLRDRATTFTKSGAPQMRLLGLSEETIYRAKISGGALREGEKCSREKVSDTEIDRQLVRECIAALLTDAGEGENAFTLLLVHEPQFLEVYAVPGINLIFAGHAHGGQIRLPFTQGLFAPGQGILPKLTSGMHQSGNSTMVISMGMGNSTFPFRVFNRPEVVVIQVESQQ